MQWSDAIKEYIDALKPVDINQALLMKMVRTIDLTSLNDTDTESSVAFMFQKARTSFGNVAAVCVYPKFVRLAATEFAGSSIQVATVVNFPSGQSSLDQVLIEINQALEDGAQEIDVVFPYHRYLAGEQQYAQTFVSTCKAACGDQAILKVILETGALGDPAIIADASFAALAGGADFIKTSTGKIPEGATLEAAATMLLVIKHLLPQLKHSVGIKISGGVRDVALAARYMALTDLIMGKEWLSPETFRIGASKLLDEMVSEMG